MLIKIIIFGTTLALVKAGLFGFGHGHVSSTNNVIHHIVPHHFATGSLTNDNHHHRYSLPKYEYEYSVGDPHTGDHKSQHESRNGDTVRGYYNLVQPDGTVREVHYTADAHGFNAEVHNSATSTHPAPPHGIHYN